MLSSAAATSPPLPSPSVTDSASASAVHPSVDVSLHADQHVHPHSHPLPLPPPPSSSPSPASASGPHTFALQPPLQYNFFPTINSAPAHAHAHAHSMNISNNGMPSQQQPPYHMQISSNPLASMSMGMNMSMPMAMGMGMGVGSMGMSGGVHLSPVLGSTSNYLQPSSHSQSLPPPATASAPVPAAASSVAVDSSAATGVAGSSSPPQYNVNIQKRKADPVSRRSSHGSHSKKKRRDAALDSDSSDSEDIALDDELSEGEEKQGFGSAGIMTEKDLEEAAAWGQEQHGITDIAIPAAVSAVAIQTDYMVTSDILSIRLKPSVSTPHRDDVQDRWAYAFLPHPTCEYLGPSYMFTFHGVQYQVTYSGDSPIKKDMKINSNFIIHYTGPSGKTLQRKFTILRQYPAIKAAPKKFVQINQSLVFEVECVSEVPMYKQPHTGQYQFLIKKYDQNNPKPMHTQHSNANNIIVPNTSVSTSNSTTSHISNQHENTHAHQSAADLSLASGGVSSYPAPSASPSSYVSLSSSALSLSASALLDDRSTEAINSLNTDPNMTADQLHLEPL